MFLSPALLGFLALATAPIIIHLLNRRQFDRVEWAPMRVLKLTVKRNRRRVQLEHWLLLAIRTLAVVALILAIARPMSSGRTIAGLFDLPGRAGRVLVLDDSLSMGATAGGTSPWTQAVDAAAEVLEQAGSGDEVSILLASRGEALARQADVATAAATLSELKSRDPSDATIDWAATLDRAGQLLDNGSLPVQNATLVTDRQSVGWSDAVADSLADWGDRSLTVVDVSVPRGDNLTAAGIMQVDPIVIAGSPALLSARIASQRQSAADGEQATLLVSDREEALTLPAVPGAGEIRVPLTRSFPEGGTKRIELRLPEDSLPGDSRTFAVVEVRPELEVVLIDGDIRPGAFESETDFVALSMQAGYSRVSLSRVSPADWALEPLGEPDLIVLANVADLPRDRIKELERLVRGGSGLMVFPGATLDPETTNAALHQGGEGLLPFAYAESSPAEFAGMTVAELSDSPLSALASLTPAAFADIRPERIFPIVTPEDDSDARILARWNDADQTPAAIGRRFGAGRVLQWTVAADRDGSNWPTQPSFVLAMRSATLALARQSGVNANVVAGEPLRLRFPEGIRPEAATVKRPGAEQATDATLIGDRTEAIYAQTDRAGFYEVAYTLPNGTSQSQLFAVRPDDRESAAERIGDDELRSLAASVDLRLIDFGTTATGPREEATELWPYAIAALLTLLLLDTALSTWIDRRRRPQRLPEAIATGVTA